MKAVCLVFALLSQPAFAQLAPAPGSENAKPRVYISAAEVAALVSQANTTAQAGGPQGLKTLLLDGPHWVVLGYHKPVQPGAKIEYRANVTEAELAVVLDGAGTICFGGKLIDPKPAGKDSFVSDKVEGAVPYKLSKGDMILIPEGSPHAVTEIDSKLTMMSVHLPRTSEN